VCLVFIAVGCGVLAMASVSVKPLYVFLMLVLILFWGSSFVVVKVTLEAGLTPIAIATFRFLVQVPFFYWCSSLTRLEIEVIGC
jgi:hypothetical protein